MSAENIHFPQEFHESNPIGVEEVLVAGNRGPCGGVNMAFEAANQVLDIVAGREKVYINWDLVNNKPIMEKYAQRGLVNVKNDLSLVPDGSIFLFSAHGVPPTLHEQAHEKNLLTIDTTCQLVNRVHNLAKNAAERGQHVIYVGKDGHPETIGTMGEVPLGQITLVEKPEDINRLELPDVPKVVYSQTTLATDEIGDTMRALREKYGEDITIPNRWDICYATDNRQAAVDELIKMVDMLLVVGSKHSHNSQELRKKGEKEGLLSISIDTATEIEKVWFDDIKKVGVTSGASVIEEYTDEVLDYFRAFGIPITNLPQVKEEKSMTFRLPEENIDALRMRYGLETLKVANQ